MPLDRIYRGPKDPASDDQLVGWLSAPPPWRDHKDEPALLPRVIPADPVAQWRGQSYVPTGEDELDRVNLALWLRRPILVSGQPGTGKSSLAYGIAEALGLGPPLRWEINSQSTLRQGLYHYDAVAHFHAARVRQADVPASEFIRLGPLGTAFLPTERPRVLLVDELDKASWDLPNDLLHVFEEGAFTIPELARQAQVARVELDDGTSPDDRVKLAGARIRVKHHPVVIITSNDEKEFSDAFKRRCVPLRMTPLTIDRLADVVRSQLGDDPGLLVALELFDGDETDIVLQTLFSESHGADRDAVRTVLRRS